MPSLVATIGLIESYPYRYLDHSELIPIFFQIFIPIPIPIYQYLVSDSLSEGEGI